MAGFSVDHTELRQAANELRSIHDELAETVGPRNEMPPGQVGHAELATAIADFQDGSRQAATCLFADTQAATDRLTLNADHYRHTQRLIEDLLSAQGN